MIYSKVEIYCNNCGKKLYIEYPRAIGREYKVCSIECLRELELKKSYSITGSEYKKDKTNV